MTRHVSTPFISSIVIRAIVIMLLFLESGCSIKCRRGMRSANQPTGFSAWIAPLRIGMSEEEVHQQFPSFCATHDYFLASTSQRYDGGPITLSNGLYLQLGFLDSRLVAIECFDSRPRLPGGIGVGSTLAEVEEQQRRIPVPVCQPGYGLFIQLSDTAWGVFVRGLEAARPNDKIEKVQLRDPNEPYTQVLIGYIERAQESAR